MTKVYKSLTLKKRVSVTLVQTVHASHLVEPASEGHNIWSRAVLLLLVPATA